MPSARRTGGFASAGQAGTRSSDSEDDDPQAPYRAHFYGNRITPEIRRGQQRMNYGMVLDALRPG
jgi:hypothetical protein